MCDKMDIEKIKEKIIFSTTPTPHLLYFNKDQWNSVPPLLKIRLRACQFYQDNMNWEKEYTT